MKNLFLKIRILQIDMRDITTGEVKLKESINCQIGTTFITDDQLVVVSIDGNGWFVYLISDKIRTF